MKKSESYAVISDRIPMRTFCDRWYASVYGSDAYCSLLYETEYVRSVHSNAFWRGGVIWRTRLEHGADISDGTVCDGNG